MENGKYDHEKITCQQFSSTDFKTEQFCEYHSEWLFENAR